MHVMLCDDWASAVAGDGTAVARTAKHAKCEREGNSFHAVPRSLGSKRLIEGAATVLPGADSAV